MKKLFLSIPLTCLIAATSCKKEPEVVTETVVVTDTVTVTNTVIDTLRVTETENNSVGLYLEKFDQLHIGSGFGWGSATQNYSVTNLGDKKISSLKVKFEAVTADNSVYTSTDYVFDLGIGETVSSQGYIGTADKECVSVKVKELEITTE